MTVDEIAAALCTIRCLPKGKLPSLISWMLDEWGDNLSTIDPVVSDWETRVVANGGAAPSDATVQALNTFYTALVSEGLHSRMIAVNCIVPDNLTAALTPLIVGPGNDPWTNAGSSLFVGANLTLNGLVGAVNKHLDTGINPFTAFSNDTSFGMSAYSTTVSASAGVVFGCRTDNTHLVKMYIEYLDNNCYWDNWSEAAGGRISGANAGWAGFISGNRTSAGATAIYKANGSTAFTTIASGLATAGSRPNLSLSMYDYNINGVFGPNSETRRFSFAAIHLGLSSGQAQFLYNSVVTLRTALGGGLIP